MLPKMFVMEVEFRKQQEKEKQSAIKEKDEYKKQHTKLVNERNDLKNELERKQRLAMQAIAARSSMKEHLDEAKKNYENSLVQIEEYKYQLSSAAKDVERFKRKHDDMFTSVSGLNQRIEELENHKLHLLSKLKNYGDRGDLSYIVKTQKLENIRAKEL